MKVYIIIKNNEEEYEDYFEWIEEVYKNKEKAETRFLELIKTNKYKKDRRINIQKYYKDSENELIDVGAYRLEIHEVIE